ncbi:hypothetical protein GCM10019059_23400 [Camelimonas fluminis]|uniref:ABC transporter ATP-binding protein/permease n=1 Tax=Camelimonas fluminis TaxID=1576911 RepID=A0ABV7UHC0_9HYPH|nr:ABC transporter ATP-binding protein/permease [Camelimonas fluminis]GHE63127.1 hypothetical protein GCM10019059_23400 [Camelimonas fluminis]
MERNPIRFVWQNSRLLHLVALLALLVMAPVNWLLLELPRILVDDAVLGLAFRDRTVASFLPLAIPLPERMFQSGWRLFQGLALERNAYFLAGCIAVLGLLALRSLLISMVAALRSIIARRLASLLRLRLFRRIAGSRGMTHDDADDVAQLSGGGLSAIAWFFGDAIIVPTMALSQLAIVLAFGVHVGVHSGAMLLGLTIANVIVILWVARAEARLADEARRRERTMTRAARGAASRAVAIQLHGAFGVEEGYFRSLLTRLDALWRPLARKVSLASAARAFLRECGPLLMITWGCWWVMQGRLTLGGMVSLVFASVLLQRPVNALVAWRRERERARAVLGDIARANGSLAARRPREALPITSGTLAAPLTAEGVAAFDPASGLRVSGVSLSVPLPAHVALVGEPGSGAEVFAGLLGGAFDATAGSIRIGERPLQSIAGPTRPKFIAYAGGAPIVLTGTVLENLQYGCAEWGDDRGLVHGPDRATLEEVIRVAGLDDAVYALGLAATVENGADPQIAARVVAARSAVRDELERADAAALVDPFDPAAYNMHATVAENLMFGLPVGDTFGESNLASHPFVRAVLAAEDLGRPLEQMGLAVARSMLEMFEGVPEGHPLFRQFSFFHYGERGAYEELLDRHAGDRRPRGAAAARDRDLLVNLAFRYVESRHRLGLLDDSLKQRIVQARPVFRELLPRSLESAVAFYDPDEVCRAASLADNLLFGRVAHHIAGAEEKIQGVIAATLKQAGLDDLVISSGLSSRISAEDMRAMAGRENQLDLARCLARRPDMLVAVGVTENLSPSQTLALLNRLRVWLDGRSLFITMRDEELAEDMRAVPFARGGLARSGAVTGVDNGENLA